MWLARLWDGWKTPLILVRPETVIRWHRQGFKLYWRWKSRPKRLGRPSIPREHIAFIRRMSADNLSWGEDKIDEELRVKFGVSHSTSTIRRYMVRRRPRSDGEFQGSCRINQFHAADFSRSGFSLTISTRFQFRVSPVHRSGFRFRAAS